MSSRAVPSETAFRRPNDSLWWTEQWRAAGDLAAFWAALPRLASGPSGDGHAVLVLPGFLADDGSTAPLRAVLHLRGYDAAPWRLGRNLGPTSHIWDGLAQRLHHLNEASGAPVTILGWSLGGILGRHLARRYPDLCRQVITLGSPFRLPADHDPRTTTVGEIFHALQPLHTDLFSSVSSSMLDEPMPLPATAIYSRLDGVVPWAACLEPPAPHAESIEVRASHCGMGVHPQVLRVVLDRLEQPQGAWQPYRGTSVAAVA
ncbi:PGAP1 family protein [Nostocoides japonicum T1-X7]|uniref:PGAP1 family protein n=1 Tax=Nostocoides japonicum T1-X7 TaxID=1194083 RepID=A0A077LWG6_9MICO|nr:alpha/beta fold hydrolase [Tetrasphaera japonica]CCH76359.1 PGAP1 family protein [Tetrasphaera japonica T1-X7]